MRVFYEGISVSAFEVAALVKAAQGILNECAKRYDADGSLILPAEVEGPLVDAMRPFKAKP